MAGPREEDEEIVADREEALIAKILAQQLRGVSHGMLREEPPLLDFRTRIPLALAERGSPI